MINVIEFAYLKRKNRDTGTKISYILCVIATCYVLLIGSINKDAINF